MIEKQQKFSYTPEERAQATKDLAEFIEDMVCAFGGFADLPKTPVKITEDSRSLKVRIPVERNRDMGIVFGPNGSNVAALLHFIRNQQILKHNKKIDLEFLTQGVNAGDAVFMVSDSWVFTSTGAKIDYDDWHANRGIIPQHIKAEKLDLYRIEVSPLGKTIPARDLPMYQASSARMKYHEIFNFDFGTQLGPDPDMSVNRYQQLAGETAIYPDRGSNVSYAVLGLSSEAGEVAGVLKKIIRDEGGELTAEGRQKLAKELGDVTWYCAALAHELGIPLSEVMAMNIKKLHDRKERNVLSGSGDNR